jgi:hypothetical protein
MPDAHTIQAFSELLAKGGPIAVIAILLLGAWAFYKRWIYFGSQVTDLLAAKDDRIRDRDATIAVQAATILKQDAKIDHLTDVFEGAVDALRHVAPLRRRVRPE